MEHNLHKRILTAFLVLAMLGTGGEPALAAGADPSAIDRTRGAGLSVNLTYVDNDKYSPVEGGEFIIYQAGEIDEEGKYRQTGAFASAGPVISSNTMESVSSMQLAAMALANAAASGKIDGVSVTTDAQGDAVYGSIDGEHFGIYLVVQTGRSGDAAKYELAAPFLVQVPCPDGNGGWVYDVVARPKPEKVPVNPPPGHRNPPPEKPTPPPPATPTPPPPPTPLVPGKPGKPGKSRTPSTGKKAVIEEILPEEVPLANLAMPPATGDNSRAPLFLGGSVAAAGALGVWFVLWKRKKK